MSENIDKLSGAQPNWDKVVFFFKTESTVQAEMDLENIKKSYLEFERPMQAWFLTGGEVNLKGMKQHEMVGMILFLEKPENWNAMLKAISSMSDNEIRDNPTIPADEFHSWHLVNFENKEETIGLVQSAFEIWTKRIKGLKEKLVPKYIEDGDKLLDKTGKMGKVK